MNWGHHLRDQGEKALQHHSSLLKSADSTSGFSQKLRRRLYTTVTERTLAHEASTWSESLTQRLGNKSSIQRPFLLNITGAYRTTSTAALQVIAGLMPLHLKIKLESEYVRSTRLRQIIVVG
ncbi:hypothetical protein AVEN_69015-1 [Araneus ventricosus]|uniref:Uncharacterized protein n=1 Tax=Araneus ventricosus TaxID=182803 RepID=A0A4Y2DB77_ARAVE|nr:hypothetical protein AVEN_69015-1 [Araneus ventricosus]